MTIFDWAPMRKSYAEIYHTSMIYTYAHGPVFITRVLALHINSAYQMCDRDTHRDD